MPKINSNRRFIDITTIYSKVDDARREEAYINKTSNTMSDYVKQDILSPYMDFRKRYNAEHGKPAPCLEVVLDQYLTNKHVESWTEERELDKVG